MQYFKVHHFHFSHRRKTNVLSSLPIRITNLNKQRLFLELKKIFSLFLLPSGQTIIVRCFWLRWRQRWLARFWERRKHCNLKMTTYACYQANSASYLMWNGKLVPAPKCGDALRLGSKGLIAHTIRGSICGWRVKLCDPSLTHAILSALEVSSSSSSF